MSNTNEIMVEQINQFWTILNDMASSDPQSYKRFIEKNLNDGKDWMKTPEEHMIVETRSLENNCVVYIVFFEWYKVPAPKCDTDPIPIYNGDFMRILGDVEKLLISVAFNPNILKEYGTNSSQENLNMIVDLAITSLNNFRNKQLSHNFVFLDKSKKLDKKLAIHSLMKSNNEMENLSDSYLSSKCYENKLDFFCDKLLNNPNKEDGSTEIFSTSNLLTFLPPTKPPKKLIEEISQPLSVVPPKYEQIILENNGKHVVSVKIYLPGITNIHECTLDVSERDLVLTANNVYYLHINLLKKVDPVQTVAEFDKLHSVLYVKSTCV